MQVTTPQVWLENRHNRYGLDRPHLVAAPAPASRLAIASSWNWPGLAIGAGQTAVNIQELTGYGRRYPGASHILVDGLGVPVNQRIVGNAGGQVVYAPLLPALTLLPGLGYEVPGTISQPDRFLGRLVSETPQQAQGGPPIKLWLARTEQGEVVIVTDTRPWAEVEIRMNIDGTEGNSTMQRMAGSGAIWTRVDNQDATTYTLVAGNGYTLPRTATRPSTLSTA